MGIILRVSLLIILLSNMSFGQGSFLELEIGSENKDQLKIIFNLGNSDITYTKVLNLDSADGLKKYNFKFDSNISNIRFLWHQKNVIKIESLEVGYEKDTIKWGPEEILSYFVINRFVTKKSIENGVLHLENAPPTKGNYPFLHFNKPGKDIERKATDNIDLIPSSLFISCQTDQPVLISAYTKNENMNEQYSGVKYINSAKEVQLYELPILTTEKYEKFRIIIYANENTQFKLSSLEIKNAESKRIWNDFEIKKYFTVYTRGKEHKLNSEHLEYSFDESLELSIKKNIISKREEIIAMALSCFSFILATAILYKLNRRFIFRINLK